MTWKRKAYQVVAALEGTVVEWWSQGRETFASVTVQTEDGLFHGAYSKCLYLSLGNNIFDTYNGALSISVGIDKEGTNRFHVACKNPPRKHLKRVLRAFLRLNHPDFHLKEVLAACKVANRTAEEEGSEIRAAFGIGLEPELMAAFGIRVEDERV